MLNLKQGLLSAQCLTLAVFGTLYTNHASAAHVISFGLSGGTGGAPFITCHKGTDSQQAPVRIKELRVRSGY
jgi:Jacalin-like lectin domain